MNTFIRGSRDPRKMANPLVDNHCFNPFSPTKAPNLAELCNLIIRQAIELESYPNHPWIEQVL